MDQSLCTSTCWCQTGAQQLNASLYALEHETTKSAPKSKTATNLVLGDILLMQGLKPKHTLTIKGNINRLLPDEDEKL
eukprot:1137402-Pelagomonas_calceolata.AAC.2